MKKEINQLKAGTLLTYLTMIVSSVIPMLYTPLMLQLMGKDEYGLYSLSSSVIHYLGLLNLGLGSTILRYYMRYLTEGNKLMAERVIGLFSLLFGIISVVTMVVGCSLTLFTGSLFAKGLSDAEIAKMNILVILLSVNSGITLLSAPLVTIVIGNERYIFQKVSALLFTFASPILNLIILYMGYASIGIACVSIVCSIATFFVDLTYCTKKLHTRPRFKQMPFGILKEIFAFTLVVFLSTIAELLYWSTDKVLIGAMIGTAAVAVYNIGITFNTIMQQLSSAISGVFAPRVNRLVFSNQPISAITELMTRVGRLQYLIISLVLSGFIVFGKAFLGFWVGEGYEEAYPVAILTMIPMVVPLIQNVAFTAIVAMNKHKFRSNLYLILAIANVVATFFAIPHFGIVGAAMCTFVVFILGHGIIMNWFYYKKININIFSFWKNILKMSIVPAVLTVCGLLFQYYVFNIDTLLTFAIGVVVYTIIFCGLSWLISMNAYEKKLITDLIRKILPQKKSVC